MKSISSYFGSGQRSSATTFSSLSAASRTLVHRRDLVVAGVDRQLEALEAGVGVRRLQLAQRLDQLVDQLRDLARDAVATPASLISARWRSAAGRIIVLAIEKVVSASMLARIAYCSTQTS